MSKKVYGGDFVLNGKSVRGIMSGTQKQVASVLGCSVGHIRKYWSETGNDNELRIASGAPGVLFSCASVYSSAPYKRVPCRVCGRVDDNHLEDVKHREGVEHD